MIYLFLISNDYLTFETLAWSTKPVLSRWSIFVANSQQYIVWVKIIIFSFMPKIISILSKDHVPLIFFLISYCKYIKTKSLIWTTLKEICSIFGVFCTLRFQIFKYCPIITTYINGNMIYSAFRWCINRNLGKWTLMVLWFRVTFYVLFIKTLFLHL